MIDQKPKIVVVTPVKNEAWILDRFLAVTSEFADQIIIADQNSTDGSIEICKKYSKVTLIENNSIQYDEASRQILLLETARKLVPEPRIILALDADEILAANAMQTCGWQTMLKAKPGTILCFEKPDLFNSPHQCVRYDNCWPLGYVDDGAEHKPKQIHSIRIPQPEYATKLYIHDIKILHYALTRLDAQRAKARFYNIIENLSKTTPFYLRRYIYSSKRKYIDGNLEVSSKEWFENWEQKGIDMFSIPHTNYYWHDFEVLQKINQYGALKFWLDDIWDFDWEVYRNSVMASNLSNTQMVKVRRPPGIVMLISKLIDFLYRLKLLVNSN